MKNSLKPIMLALGCLCVFLGVVGIFLPLLPTTPFLLLAAWLFSKSSDRFHSWLIEHPRLGPIIKAWQSGDGIERSLRRRVIIVLWLSMILSMIIVSKLWAVLLLSAIGAMVTTYLLKQPVID